MIKQKEYKWKECYKLDCSPPVEIFKDFVRVFGTNYELNRLDNQIEDYEARAELFKEIKNKWNKEFGNKKTKI